MKLTTRSSNYGNEFYVVRNNFLLPNIFLSKEHETKGSGGLIGLLDKGKKNLTDSRHRPSVVESNPAPPGSEIICLSGAGSGLEINIRSGSEVTVKNPSGPL
jgi:hypothetical protein